MHTGIDLVWQQNTSNVVIEASYIHDFIVWGIDVAGVWAISII